MTIVLTNRQEGKQMPAPEKVTPTEDAQGTGRRGPTVSQMAAAVEAAYILEAVRK